MSGCIGMHTSDLYQVCCQQNAALHGSSWSILVSLLILHWGYNNKRKGKCCFVLYSGCEGKVANSLVGQCISGKGLMMKQLRSVIMDCNT